jgi:hypothetical protein
MPSKKQVFSCPNCNQRTFKKEQLCVSCKKDVVDGNLYCMVCYEYKDATTTHKDVCMDCRTIYTHASCKRCFRSTYIEIKTEYCIDCSKQNCIACILRNNRTDTDTVNTSTDTVAVLPNRMWSDIICYTCATTQDDICKLTHSTCCNQKYKCCVCKDVRKYKADCLSYSGYLDGIGHTNQMKRWEHYCPMCKSTCEAMYQHRTKV